MTRDNKPISFPEELGNAHHKLRSHLVLQQMNHQELTEQRDRLIKTADKLRKELDAAAQRLAKVTAEPRKGKNASAGRGGTLAIGLTNSRRSFAIYDSTKRDS